MGTLQEFKDFLTQRKGELMRAERRLLDQQEKYEQFFSEVSRVREREYRQLRDHIVNDADALPGELKRELEKARIEAERAFDEKLKELAKQASKIERKAEATRAKSIKAEEQLHGKNVSLDRAEEELKERNARLLREIAEYNEEIDQLGKGFGFFKNFFRMRALQRVRSTIDEEQEDLAARIDKVRAQWVEQDQEHHARELKWQQSWIKRHSDAAAIYAKLEHLRNARAAVIERTTIEQVLFTHRPTLAKPEATDPPCERCSKPNPSHYHFCHVCARRLQPDQPDLKGSLKEIAELNLHHDNFSEGMAACQEIIGLVRGLITGHENFTESVDDMLETQRKHPVSKLIISVPKASVDYSESFKTFADALVPKQTLHPTAFAGGVKRVISDRFTEGLIKNYFETMGKELSKQAGSQW